MGERRLVLFFLVSITVWLGGSGAAGAQPSPDADEVVMLSFEPGELVHDPTTDRFVIEQDVAEFTSCGRESLAITGRDGVVQWQLPGPSPCVWTVDDGQLFVADDETIRQFDIATGALIRGWAVPVNVRIDGLFPADDALWFTTGSRGSGVIEPLDGGVTTVGVRNDRVVAVSDDGRFVWFTDSRIVTRLDREAPDSLVTRNDGGFWEYWGFSLSEDGSRLFHLDQRRIRILDADTLGMLAHGGMSIRAIDVAEMADGRFVALEPSPYAPAEVLEAGTLESLGTGPSLASNYHRIHDVDLVDGRLLVAANGSPSGRPDLSWLEYHRLVPKVISTEAAVDPIDAGHPRSLFLQAQWPDAVESIRINGQDVDFRPELYGGAILGFHLDLPPLPEGTHRIILDGPLGHSPDSRAARITVGPARPRTDLDVLVRSDSVVDVVDTWTVCTTDAGLDISVKQQLAPGERVTFRVPIGSECSVQFSGDGNDWSHFTTGFFDPATDPDARDIIDLDFWSRRFNPSEPIGVAAYFPPRDLAIVWTYSYGFGSPTTDERSPVSIRCGDEQREYDTYFGYWMRTVVPRDATCTVEHATPPGAEVSGFGVIRDDHDRMQPGAVTSTTLPAGLTAHGVIVYDVYAHPSEDDGAFVRQQYLDFLGRPGEADGVRGWTSALGSGTTSRTGLVERFLESPEFGGTVAPVSRLYQAYFGRLPDRDGLFFWSNWIRGGRSLAQVSDEFARSAEFERTYGALTDAEFIDLVYVNVLGRRPDATGRQFWLDQMDGGLTRGQLMVNFSESIEFRELTDGVVLVASLYQGLLQRRPDRQGLDYWVGVVDRGGSVQDLIGGLLASDEYFARFDDLVDDLPVSAGRDVGRRSAADGVEQEIPQPADN